MKRLRILFAVGFFLFALPVWRYIDFLVVIWPSKILLTGAIVLWSLIFLTLPLYLILRKPHTLVASLTFLILSLTTEPLSSMATPDSSFNHCGHATYTGTFYPLRHILPAAHQDDLELRNQFCWIRKMVVKTPSDGDPETIKKITETKLFHPELKYKASLPLIAVLLGTVNGTTASITGAFFWREHYTYEISTTDYAWWNWPHSQYIKWEYGFIEKNWEDLLLNFNH